MMIGVDVRFANAMDQFTDIAYQNTALRSAQSLIFVAADEDEVVAIELNPEGFCDSCGQFDLELWDESVHDVLHDTAPWFAGVSARLRVVGNRSGEIVACVGMERIFVQTMTLDIVDPAASWVPVDIPEPLCDLLVPVRRYVTHQG